MGRGDRSLEGAATRWFFMRVMTALVYRDLVVLRKRWVEFVSRTLLQPFLLVFVFTYVFPAVGQGIADQRVFNGSLIAGVLAVTIVVQGIQAVSLPLVQEFGHTREIEDRVLAPVPLAAVAMAKIISGGCQCLIAGLMVLPIAGFVPADPVAWDIDWPLFVLMLVLSSLMAAALGLVFGTLFEPRTVPVLFGVIVVPLTFLGCVYYSWSMLSPLPWLQFAVLGNPLVYVSEGLRAALTTIPTMPPFLVVIALSCFIALFATLGLRSFERRVVS